MTKRVVSMGEGERHHVPRLARIAIPGTQVRILDVKGQLVNVSATGALVHAEADFPVGDEWPILLEVEPEPVRVTGRVVRCDPLELPGVPESHQHYAIGLMFVDMSAEAVEASAHACGVSQQFRRMLAPRRVIVVSAKPSLAEYTARTLTEAGYLVRIVGDASAAVRDVTRLGADAVVSTLPLDKEPSTWRVVELLEVNPATAALPVIVCLEATPHPAHRLGLAERVRVLVSPFTTEELVSLVEQAIRGTTG